MTLAIASSLLLACGGCGDDATPSSSADASPDVGATTPDGAPRDGDTDAGPVVATAPVHYVGRFDRSDPAGPRFAWSGTYAALRFEGTGLDAEIKDTGNNHLAVFVDGVALPKVVLSPSQTRYTLATGLAAGPHDVIVARRTEAFFGITQFVSFTPQGGRIVPTAVPTRFIEIVGDSISCGYGAEGANASCSFSADTENETIAYGALAARALSAAHVTVAWSGKGMVRNYGGDATDLMPKLYERVLPEQATSVYDFKGYTPDVVVINLGTNDFAKGDPGAAYQGAYATFVASVRTRFPSAFIVATVSPMLSGTERSQQRAYLKAVVDARNGAGDARVSLLEFAEQQQGALGCDYHPGSKTHEIMAATLAAHVKKITGWP